MEMIGQPQADPRISRVIKGKKGIGYTGNYLLSSEQLGPGASLSDPGQGG